MSGNELRATLGDAKLIAKRLRIMKPVQISGLEPDILKRAADLLESLHSTAAMPSRVTDEMVTRFLGWKLPEDFHPDAGISFQPYFNVEWNAKHGKPPQRHEPIGTNLLNADQARAMLEHVLAVAPSSIGASSAAQILRNACEAYRDKASIDWACKNYDASIYPSANGGKSE